VIVFSMQIMAPEKTRKVLLRTLSAALGPTRVAPGCLDARLYADAENEKTLMLVEEWESREEFDEQLDADKVKTLVAAIELSSNAPVLHIDEVTREEGIGALARCRSEP
jgi:quinol monooxygenase YgiN